MTSMGSWAAIMAGKTFSLSSSMAPCDEFLTHPDMTCRRGTATQAMGAGTDGTDRA